MSWRVTCGNTGQVILLNHSQVELSYSYPVQIGPASHQALTHPPFCSFILSVRSLLVGLCSLKSVHLFIDFFFQPAITHQTCPRFSGLVISSTCEQPLLHLSNRDGENPPHSWRRLWHLTDAPPGLAGSSSGAGGNLLWLPWNKGDQPRRRWHFPLC